jgi:hypothetical protein
VVVSEVLSSTVQAINNHTVISPYEQPPNNYAHNNHDDH